MFPLFPACPRQRRPPGPESRATAPSRSVSSCEYHCVDPSIQPKRPLLVVSRLDTRQSIRPRSSNAVSVCFLRQVLRLLCQRRVLQQLQLQQLLQQPGARNGASEGHQDLPGPEPRGVQAKDRQRQGGRVGPAAQQRLQLQALGLLEELLRVLRGGCRSRNSPRVLAHTHAPTGGAG